MSKTIYTGPETKDPGDQISACVVDNPGHGGAHHHYAVEAGNYPFMAEVKFQNGPLAEAGINGVTNEVLLAIVAHRLECFQDGPYECEENAIALARVEEAMEVLALRTASRKARGVEGTHQV